MRGNDLAAIRDLQSCRYHPYFHRRTFRFEAFFAHIHNIVHDDHLHIIALTVAQSRIHTRYVCSIILQYTDDQYGQLMHRILIQASDVNMASHPIHLAAHIPAKYKMPPIQKYCWV